MRSAENPTLTWLRFQQLDSASGETQLHQAKAKRAETSFYRAPANYRLLEIPQESPVLQQPAVPSSQATSTVDAILTVPPLKQNGNSTPRTPRPPGHLEYPGEVPKEFHPQGLDCRSDISCTDILISEREMLRYGSYRRRRRYCRYANRP